MASSVEDMCGGSDTCLLLVRHGVPMVGILFSACISLSSLPAIVRVYKRGGHGSLNPYPYAVLFLTALHWTMYGIMMRDVYVVVNSMISTIVVFTYSLMLLATPTKRIGPRAGTGSAPGSSTASVSMSGSLLAHDKLASPTTPLDSAAATPRPRPAHRNPMKQLHDSRHLILMAVMVFGFVFVMVTACVMILYVGPRNEELATLIMGYIGMSFSVLFYSSPLFVVFKALKLKDASFFSWPLTITVLASCVCWAVYGLVIHDWCLFIPNALGIPFALVQLALLTIFGKKNRHPPRRLARLPNFRPKSHASSHYLASSSSSMYDSQLSHPDMAQRSDSLLVTPLYDQCKVDVDSGAGASRG